jgi:hypothetical protein
MASEIGSRYGRRMTHYASAFYVQPGQCFRFVHSGVGHAAHCREPVVVHGTFIDGKGRRVSLGYVTMDL